MRPRSDYPLIGLPRGWRLPKEYTHDCTEEEFWGKHAPATEEQKRALLQWLRGPVGESGKNS